DFDVRKVLAVKPQRHQGNPSHVWQAAKHASDDVATVRAETGLAHHGVAVACGRERRIVFRDARTEQALGARTVTSDGDHRKQVASRAMNETDLRTGSGNGRGNREK